MGNINGLYCFAYSSGEDIYLFTLRNVKGTEVCNSNYRAIITSIKVKLGNGSINDIVWVSLQQKIIYQKNIIPVTPVLALLLAAMLTTSGMASSALMIKKISEIEETETQLLV